MIEARGLALFQEADDKEVVVHRVRMGMGMLLLLRQRAGRRRGRGQRSSMGGSIPAAAQIDLDRIVVVGAIPKAQANVVCATKRRPGHRLQHREWMLP